MKQPRTGEYKATDLNGLVGTIAARYGRAAKVSAKLGALKYPWEPQSEESDFHLLARLARDHDAVYKIAGSEILFLARDEIAASIAFSITDFIECSVDDDDRSKHGKATGHYHDRGKAERIPETYNSDDGSDGPEAMLRHTYPDADRAMAAAKGRMSRLQRLEKRLHGVLTGNTGIMAGMVGTIAWGVELYDGDYALKTVCHEIKKGHGFTTTIDSHKGRAGKGT